MVRLYRLLTLLSIAYFFSPNSCSAFQPPTPDHVVILVLENHGFNQIFGAASAPYLNGLINDPYCAFFTQSYALTHPSQPNYLQLFSGSDQGVIDDNLPAVLPLTTANLGAELLAASKSFIGYSEDLPSIGFTGETFAYYARKHSPWVNWQGVGMNGIPISSNQPFSSFPSNYNLLPTLSFVIPNLTNDMHDGIDPLRIEIGDTWVKNNLDGYIQWAKSHNSLLIITFDEDEFFSNQQIFTLIIGNSVLHGNYSDTINHYNVLRTVEDLYALPHAGNALTATTIDYCWNPCVASLPVVSIQNSSTVCAGTLTTLTSSLASSYLWSNGSTTQSITIDKVDTLSVFVTLLNGCNGTSAQVITDLNSSQLLDGICNYPNPATSYFWLNYYLPNNKDGWMRIYNTRGELVQKRRLYWSTTQLQYYTDDLKNGLYFIEVQSDAGTKASAKVLVIH